MSTRVAAMWAARPEVAGPRKYRAACRYESYVPDLLDNRMATLDPVSAADVVDAERALAAFDVRAHTPHGLEKLARFLLRAEAVASSQIEGLEVSSRRLARREAEQKAGRGGRDQTAEEVLGNVEAMVLAVDTVAVVDTVTVDHIRAVHAQLMSRSRRPDLGGIVRTEQNWIGGNPFNPCSAAFVPPPPEMVPALLDDLCAFMNRDDLPAVVQAGLVHAQFETIHPFADGNGRTGRALIQVVLRRRKATTSFVPPISLVLATLSDAYVAGLTSYRYDAEADSAAAREGIQAWLDIFVTATARATADAEALCARMVELEESWRAKLKPRRGSTADLILPFMMGTPVLTVADVVSLVGVTTAVAAGAVNQLVEAGILTQTTVGRRNRTFEASDVFDVLTDFERALATRSGDTRAERPQRPVPYRNDHG